MQRGVIFISGITLTANTSQCELSAAQFSKCFPGTAGVGDRGGTVTGNPKQKFDDVDVC